MVEWITNPVLALVADSQVASRWGNILEFQGFDLITPNEREARFSLASRALLATSARDSEVCGCANSEGGNIRTLRTIAMSLSRIIVRELGRRNLLRH